MTGKLHRQSGIHSEPNELIEKSSPLTGEGAGLHLVIARSDCDEAILVGLPRLRLAMTSLIFVIARYSVPKQSGHYPLPRREMGQLAFPPHLSPLPRGERRLMLFPLP